MPRRKKTDDSHEPEYRLMDHVFRSDDIARGLFNVTGFDTIEHSKAGRVLMPRMEVGGTLRRSIAFELEEEGDVLTVVIRAHAPYAAYVEKGVNSHNMPAQPFMLPALEEIKDQIVPILLAHKISR